jgi:polysaccharide chain length determinant protein (PEP-CTERM system associated)
MRELLDTVIAELKGSWRFRWAAIAIAWLVCLIGWPIVYAVPDTYEARAVVLFDSTSDLDKLLESMTVNADMLSRVEAMRTAMLGRKTMEKVIGETNLDRRIKGSGGIDQVINRLRANIQIISNQQRGGNIYEITYRDSDPQMAEAVVSALLDTFVEGTLGANREDSQRTQEFLSSEIASLEADLTTAEARLADFKRENVGRMPGEGGDYFARLQAEMSALEEAESQLRQANRRQETLSRQLSGEQPSISADSPLGGVEARIAENERRLEELELRFTERHPDVVALRATIEQLQAQRDRELAELRENDATEIISDNPVFQNIQIEISKINVEIASLRERVRTHRKKIEEYRELIDVLPQVEAELARLNRDYDVKQAQYRALLQKLEVAELSDAAEQSGDIKFQIIDSPREPLYPVAPNRPLLLAGVLFLGLAAGGGIAFLRNQLHPVFLQTKTIRQITDLPVLGIVSRIETPEFHRKHVTEISAFSGVFVLLCAAFIAVVLFHEPAVQLIRLFLADFATV